MLYQIAFYAALVLAGLGTYFGYDYGVASTKAAAQTAADKLTDGSVVIADASADKKEKTRIIYRDVIRNVETASDPTTCLDAHPGSAVADSVRRIQSGPSSR